MQNFKFPVAYIFAPSSYSDTCIFTLTVHISHHTCIYQLINIMYANINFALRLAFMFVYLFSGAGADNSIKLCSDEYSTVMIIAGLVSITMLTCRSMIIARSRLSKAT